MKRSILLSAAILALFVAVGCTGVSSALGGNTSMTGDAWFTEVTGMPSMVPGMPGMAFSTRIYYCPAPSGGPATCVEAEYVEAGGEASGGGDGGGEEPAAEEPAAEEPAAEEEAEEEAAEE
jgi:hypothetical protein